jgi:protocatechuate 3,4-dioxygenase beta subunit
MGIPEPDSGGRQRGASGNADSDERRAPAGPVLTGSEHAQSDSPMSLTTTVADESGPAVSDAASDTWTLELPTNDDRTTRR